MSGLAWRDRDLALVRSLEMARRTVRASKTSLENLIAGPAKVRVLPLLTQLRDAEQQLTDELNIVNERLRRALA